MSYDIELVNPVTSETLKMSTKHYMTGGTYPIGGTDELSLNITYNYSKFYYDTIDKEMGIRKLYGMSAVDSIPLLKSAISKLGNDTSGNYWEPLEGHAKIPLIQMLTMAKMRPDGVWKGD